VPAATAVEPAAPLAAAARQAGDLLLADHFGSAALGHLPAAAPPPGHYRLEYRWGQYAIARTDPAWTETVWVLVPGTYADAALVVDVAVSGGAAREVRLCCRGEVAPSTGYQLHVAPAERRFALHRCDGGQLVALVDWRDAPALRPGDQPNRLELGAAGSSVTVSINGQAVAELRDTTYAAGTFWLGLYAGDTAPAEAVFAGFQVLQR
jgi:hypothetical protein